MTYVKHRWQFEVKPISKIGTKGPERYGLYIKGSMYPWARAVIYDKEIAEELAKQLEEAYSS